MTGKVFLLNHEEYAICAEMVRLFFGQCRREDDHLLFPYDYHLSTSATSPGIEIMIDPAVDSACLQALRYKTVYTPEELEPLTRIQIRVEAERRYEASCRTNLVQLRRKLKMTLYQVLQEWTGISFPWGSLSGVRPTQICAELLAQSGEQRAREILLRDYRLLPDKAQLGFEVAGREQAILSQYNSGDFVVYCGIPFCPTRCSYCSFTTRDAMRYQDLLPDYVEAVIKEAKTVFRHWRQGSAAAVYFGGGTPTCLPAGLFEYYIDELLRYIPHDSTSELTMEAGRPDTLDRKKLELIKEHGFTRLCINPQTMHDASLQRIGRRHTVAETLKAYQSARGLGFTSINMDLIFGLPGEPVSAFVSSLEQIISLAPESITLHSLALKHSSRLLSEIKADDALAASLPDPELTAGLEKAYGLLRAAGYQPYYLYKQKRSRGALENTGFALSGHESAYNVLMMSDRCHVIGLGSGSTSKFSAGSNVVRQYNSKDLGDYISRADEFACRKAALFLQAKVDRDD
ncbi:MAG: coproporphyrinogen dehydrogenase HemZ [Clostridiaceae bacterium]|nr:coproporphyrinogen dehydrogenase HemZ [Clostridiaceae bacterium]